MALRVFPLAVRMMQASKSMRLRHELWHYVRAVWGNPAFPDAGRQILRDLGWALPEDRSPTDANRVLLLDNASGEDFLYMHRDMIRMTDTALQDMGELPISRWAKIPEPGDADFPVPPVWQYPDSDGNPDPEMIGFLEDVKSDSYFENTMKVRESFLTEPSNLRRLSLGALGNIAEMTIHNMMHMRWSAEPLGYRPGIRITDPTAGDPEWDSVDYDYLGDTYSSQVNPHFWYLHGWIDNLIDLWAEAHRVTEIQWKGTWLGGPDLIDDPHMMTMSHAGVMPRAFSENEASDKIRELVEVTRGIAVPTTLAEIARIDF